MKYRVSLVILSLLLSVLIGTILSRSGKSAQSAAAGAHHRPLIGFSLDTLKEERWVGDRNIFVAKAKALGDDVLVQSANGDDARQIQDVQSLISRGVDVLVIVPHNGAAMAKGVRLAKEAHIPVISYDRLITGSDVDLYITFNNVKVGELQAQYMVDHLPKPTAKIIRIYGAKTDHNAVLFKEGQDKVLNPYIKSGQIKVIHADWADDWKPINAKRIVNAAITQNGDDFDGILASNDDTAGGAIQALIEEGLAGKVIVTGQDADLAACQRIVNGTQSMTIYKPIKKLAQRAAELADKLARHQVVIAKNEINNGYKEVPSVFLNVKVVTKDNIDKTVIADGFHTKKQIYRDSSK